MFRQPLSRTTIDYALHAGRKEQRLIDLHCHILPGLDDGVATLEDAVKMARMAAEDGIKTVVATPHAFDGTFDIDPEVRDAALQELRAALAAENIPLQLLPGSDCHVSEHLIPSLKASPIHSLNNTGRAFLIEWPEGLVPAGFDQFLFDAQVAGLEPILTHPERHSEIQKRPAILGKLVERGLHVQVTADSLTGLFGRRVRRAAEKLLAAGWVDVLATDAHDPETRKPVLSKALEQAERIIGSTAIDLVTANPATFLGLKEWAE